MYIVHPCQFTLAFMHIMFEILSIASVSSLIHVKASKDYSAGYVICILMLTGYFHFMVSCNTVLADDVFLCTCTVYI